MASCCQPFLGVIRLNNATNFIVMLIYYASQCLLNHFVNSFSILYEMEVSSLILLTCKPTLMR